VVVNVPAPQLNGRRIALDKNSSDLISFIENFRAATHIGPDQVITGETELESIAAWDSLNLLSVIAMFDLKYNKDINPDNLLKCKRVGDLFNLIHEY